MVLWGTTSCASTARTPGRSDPASRSIMGWSFESSILYHDLDLPAYLTPIVGADKIGKKIPQRLKNFDPAFGFAWALGKEQKTVVRASASMHHVSPNVDFYKINQRILFGPAGNGLASFSGAG